jgi:hypothetical protein
LLGIGRRAVHVPQHTDLAVARTHLGVVHLERVDGLPAVARRVGVLGDGGAVGVRLAGGRVEVVVQEGGGEAGRDAARGELGQGGRALRGRAGRVCALRDCDVSAVNGGGERAEVRGGSPMGARRRRA